MVALPHPALPAGSLPKEKATPGYRQPDVLWLALQIIDPCPDADVLESFAHWAECLTPVVVLRPDEGLLLEVRGSLRYFSGLAVIRQRLEDELGQRGWSYRVATAPTPLAASWLARCRSVDVTRRDGLAGAIGRLPLGATAWPGHVLRTLEQMGLRSIADCLRLPRSGFARRIGRDWLDEIDRALGRKPDPRAAWRAPRVLCRSVEFPLETTDLALFADALAGMAGSLERELRRHQAQISSITLAFRHLRCPDTLTRIGFVDPVHERERLLNPLLARIERTALAEPAVALWLETSSLQPFRADLPELLPVLPDDGPRSGAGTAVSEFALVECLRGRFGKRSVYGISAIAEHRPEYAWCRWIDRPAAAGRSAAPACPAHGRPLWLLPEPERGPEPLLADEETPAASIGKTGSGKKGSDPLSVERIESGWWDGQDVRREYHIVTGAGGEKLWLYRDCLTHRWYLHGIFG